MWSTGSNNWLVRPTVTRKRLSWYLVAKTTLLIFNDTSMHGKITGVRKFYEGQINSFRKILSEMGIAWSKFYFAIVIIL
jgi:hypothetical protein